MSPAEQSDAMASRDPSPGITPQEPTDKEHGADMAEASVDSSLSSWSSESEIEDRRRPGAMVDAEDVPDRPEHVEADDQPAQEPASMSEHAETIDDDSVQAASPASTDDQVDSTAAPADQARHRDGESDSTSQSDDTLPTGDPDEHRAGNPMSSIQIDEGDQDAAGVSYPWQAGSTESGAPHMQDDVVLGTTFVQESAQPGYYDDAGERTSLTGDITRASDGADQTVNAGAAEPTGASHEIGSDTSSEAVSTEDQSGGMDSEWEPWGAGGTALDERGSAGTNSTVSEDLTTAGIHDQGDADTASSGLARARVLLNELQTIMATIEKPADQPPIDPAAQASVESMAQLGQLLDGFPNSTLEPERLGELTLLAEDLSGRDYDIRALQRFAQERELILELTAGFEQQRDLLEQIRSILSQPQD